MTEIKEEDMRIRESGRDTGQKAKNTGDSDWNMKKQKKCIFCSVSSQKILIEGKLGFACWDTYPVNKGHVLVIPYRHFPNYFDTTDDERQELWSMVDKAKIIIDKTHSPDGYNVGINIGHWAGQSIPHLHIHLIPRYQGDMKNPKGGVRGVIPDRQKY